MTYNPNFNDPRVLARTTQALGFALAVMSKTQPHPWSTRYIDRYFGQQQLPLSKYLRDVLLITTNNHWSKDTGKCKEYILNESGVRYLRDIIQETTTMTWNEYKSSLTDSENHNLDNYYHSIPYCIGSPNVCDEVRNNERKWDYKIVNQWVRREFENELAALQFNYDDKSDRLWHPIQSIRSEYKDAILAEQGLRYQYDIQCAAPTLIHQYAQQLDMDLWLTDLRNYINNKEQIRAELAESADLPVKTIKVLINALFCGAKLGNNPEFALSHLLNYDAARIEFIKTNAFILALRGDIKTCWQAIEPHTTQIYTKTQAGQERRVPMNSKRKWGVYFNLERQVLNAVRQYLTKTHNPHFLEHDGWSTVNAVDQQQLIQHVTQATGFVIKLDLIQIG